MMDEFASTMEKACQLLQSRGFWMESGTIVVNDKLFSYKIQELKRKPKKEIIQIDNKR